MGRRDHGLAAPFVVLMALVATAPTPTVGSVPLLSVTWHVFGILLVLTVAYRGQSQAINL